MRISVAMATWNGERFLSEQLDSIARQTRLPDELVVSDDDSTDNTLEVVEAFKRRAPFEVVILRNDDRVGSSDNFFRAMTECGGELIALCDQDDVWRPDKLARCEEPFRTNPWVSLVVHSGRITDESLRPLGRFPDIGRKQLVQAGAYPPFSRSYFGFALLFRSVFAQAVRPDRRPGGFFPRDRTQIGHDVWVNLVCRALGAVTLLPEELTLFRRHEPDSISVTRDGRVDRARRSLALRTEATTFREIAGVVSERRAYLAGLRPLAGELGAYSVAGLERAIASHERYARAMARRAMAYEGGRSTVRLARVINNGLRGDYGKRANGNLGLPPLARDLALGVVRRA